MNSLEMKYFVLNPTKDNAYGAASRIAINAYAKAIEDENPELAKNLIDWTLKIRCNQVGLK